MSIYYIWPVFDHYEFCRDRLKSLQKELIKEPQLLREYENITNEQKQNGIVEEFPCGDHVEYNEGQ